MTRPAALATIVALTVTLPALADDQRHPDGGAGGGGGISDATLVPGEGRDLDVEGGPHAQHGDDGPPETVGPPTRGQMEDIGREVGRTFDAIGRAFDRRDDTPQGQGGNLGNTPCCRVVAPAERPGIRRRRRAGA